MWKPTSIFEHSLAILLLFSISTWAQVTPTTTIPTAVVSNNYIYQTVSISAQSYTFAYTVTTPTTMWTAPTFAAATSSPLPACSDSMCPGLNQQRCVDASGTVYGVLCNTRFSGIVITNSGKHRLARAAEKRSYEGSVAACAEDMCDAFSATACAGFGYAHPYCEVYASITGTFETPGEIAALRLS